MPVTVRFKYAIGDRVVSSSGHKGVVSVQHVIGKHGNFYDVKDGGGFCVLSWEGAMSLVRAKSKSKSKTKTKTKMKVAKRRPRR